MTQDTAQTEVRRVLVVDDHPVVRQGIKLMINAQPDALVVDLSLDQGDGFNVVRDVHAHFPDIRVLVLSMHDEAVYAERLLAQGASGYIMKQAATEQLITALRAVLRGERFMSESLQQSLASRSSDQADSGSRLSTRELQVISLIGQGLGTREIADNLSLSVKTVETHRLTIKRKLALDTNAQLVQYAIKWHGTTGT